MRASALVLAVLLSALLAGLVEARGGGAGPRAAPREEPMGAPIRESPTSIAVPIDDQRSVVLSLPERFWVQCPRYLYVPTSLAGDGTIAQYMNARGGTVSVLYLGVVPFPRPAESETSDARVPKAVRDFAAGLPSAYKRVDWEITTGPVEFAAAQVAVDGRKVPGWRSKKYGSRPAGEYGGPRSVFSGECLLFAPTPDRLVYVALDAKGGGTTLDKATEAVSVRPTRDAAPAPRRVQLNDMAEALDPSRFPVRQIAFDVPAGFTLTRPLLSLSPEWVWAEARLDATGKPDAILRIRQSPADDTRSVEDDLAAERAVWKEGERGPAEAVETSVKGRVAWVFSHPSPRDSPTARAHDAVLRIDDLTVILSWISFGDAAAVERDRAAFVSLVRSLDHAIRW